MSNINVPFCPRIPYDHVVPTMRPRYQKQAKSVVIEYMHAVVLHTGLYTSAGTRPFSQTVSGFEISYDHSIKGFPWSKTR